MQKFIGILIAVAVMAGLVFFLATKVQREHSLVILTGNTERQPVGIEPGRYQGAQCGMTLSGAHDAAQAVAPDGRTWFFDDVGCLALWQSTNHLREEMVLWVFTRDTNTWIDARRAWFSRTDDTPMGYGFAAYSKWADGFIDLPMVIDFMTKDENLTSPETREELLGNR